MNFIRTHWIITSLIVTPIILFALFMGWSFYMWGDDIFDNAHAERIRAITLSLEDVEGKNLPPVPNQAENDSTIVGIDANDNLIRDDVELDIFTKYPGDSLKRERAAALQYAQAEQLFFMWVIGKLSMEAYLEKSSRAFGCVSNLSRPSKLISEMGLSDDEANELSRQIKRIQESVYVPIGKMMKNTLLREEEAKHIYKKYMTGSSSSGGEMCDIVIKKL
jgi:hypothetical protein